MKPEEWQQAAEARIAQLTRANLRGAEGMATAMVELATILNDAPLPMMRRNGRVRASRFRQAAADATDRVLADDYGVPPQSDPVDLALQLGALLSAIDELRHAYVDIEPPADPNDDWRVATADEEVFLIPRRGPHRPPPSRAGREEEQIQLLTRDLMPFHRMVPAKLGTLTVRLVWRELGAHFSAPPRCGAVLFPGLEFSVVPGGDGFIVEGVKFADQTTTIQRHLEAARDAGCGVVVFPELTINPVEREKLRDHLADRERWTGGGAGTPLPLLTVAGSWHEPDQGEHVNRLTVFDSYGAHVLSHDKVLAFCDDAPEGIRPGQHITVLVTEEVLVSFGICLDFCERRRGAAFPQLDVDYVLVPSCGAEKTMEGHLGTAKDMRDNFRTRSFVVQQAYPRFDPKGRERPPGYVLPPRSDLDLRVSDTEQNVDWAVYDAD